MQQNIALGDRAIVVIAAHVEVRSVLRASGELLAHGLDDVLIGSYARRVMNWPGKDVDDRRGTVAVPWVGFDASSRQGLLPSTPARAPTRRKLARRVCQANLPSGRYSSRRRPRSLKS